MEARLRAGWRHLLAGELIMWHFEGGEFAVMKEQFQIEDLDRVMKFFADSYQWRKDQECVSKEYFIDPVRKKVLFRFLVQEKSKPE